MAKTIDLAEREDLCEDVEPDQIHDGVCARVWHSRSRLHVCFRAIEHEDDDVDDAELHTCACPNETASPLDAEAV